jgi:hypothetical protein
MEDMGKPLNRQPVSGVEGVRARVEQLDGQLAVLLAEIEDIQDQLGDRNRVDPDTGRRLRGPAYFEWRQQAKHAKRKKTQEYRKLKEEARDLRRELGRLRRVSGSGAAPPPRSVCIAEHVAFLREWLGNDEPGFGVDQIASLHRVLDHIDPLPGADDAEEEA